MPLPVKLHYYVRQKYVRYYYSYSSYDYYYCISYTNSSTVLGSHYLLHSALDTLDNCKTLSTWYYNTSL